MSISDIEDHEQQNNDDHSYMAAVSTTRDNKAKDRLNEVFFEKVFALLDDSTPNYVLGYN